jgi:hypothetical protein
VKRPEKEAQIKTKSIQLIIPVLTFVLLSCETLNPGNGPLPATTLPTSIGTPYITFAKTDTLAPIETFVPTDKLAPTDTFVQTDKLMPTDTFATISAPSCSLSRRSPNDPRIKLWVLLVSGRTVQINGVLLNIQGSWYWDWGDATNSVGWFPQNHVYNLAGTYVITVFAPGCLISNQIQVTIK